MDPTTWNMIQIILWTIGIQTTVIIGLMSTMWMSINNRFEKMESRFEKMEEKILDIDRRLCRIEGAMSNKECCMLKNEGHSKKAE